MRQVEHGMGAVDKATARRRTDLLRPSLESGRPRAPVFSARASYVVSFLGGPPAALAVGGVNAQRLGRLSKDAVLLALMACTYVGAVALVVKGDEPSIRTTIVLGARLSYDTVRFADQAMGFAIFGLIYSRHRASHRARDILALDVKSRWFLGIAFVIGGLAVDSGLFTLLAAMLR